MQQDSDFTQQESLAIIQEMINKAKNRFSENGHLYLLWGWLVFICSITEFILQHFDLYEKHYLVWLSCWIAFIYQAFYLSRKYKKKYVRTYTHDIIKYVWIVFIITVVLLLFLFSMVTGKEYYKIVGPVFLALYGMPSFLSGVILRFRPLIIGGICCWGLAIASPFVPEDYRLLLLAAAMVIAWIIPGYQLNSKYKKENA